MIRAKYIFIVILLTVVPLAGQMSNTLYFMDRIPQVNQMNPAIQPKSNVYVGVPGISTFMFNIGNNSLNLSDIYQYDSQSKSVLLFMANAKTKSAFINTLKTDNSIFTSLQEDLLAFGFRVSSWYFNFNTSIKFDLSTNYPKNFVEALINGSGVGSSYEFKEFGINTNTYIEVGLGASKIINDEFTVGGKYKLLLGVVNINTNNKAFQLKTELQNDLPVNSINSDLTINMYAPSFLTEFNDTGEVTFDNILKESTNKKIEPFQSKGMAIDLGVIYSGIEKLKLSASVLDLGYISWNKNVVNLKMNGNFEFKGVDIDMDSIGNAFEDVTKAIADSFKFKTSFASYVTNLPTKLYIGAEYSLESYFSVGLLYASQYYRSQLTHQVMASANFRPLNMIMLSTSYSFFNNGFSNIGVGLTLRLAPMQIYIISDNIPIKISKDMMPYKVEYFNFRFGLNWVFGCSGDKKKMKDKPMSWE